MKLDEINLIRSQLSGIQEYLTGRLRLETDPSGVLSLISALSDVRDLADDIQMDLLSDQEKLDLADRILE